MSFMSPPAPNPIVLPSAPAAAPVFGQAPVGQKPGQRPSQPSFLGSALFATPAQTQQKSLIGT